MTEEKTFRNLLGVVVYLHAQGWKVSKSTVYEHGRGKKIKPREDGYFYLSDVEMYAGDYLNKKNAPQTTPKSDVIQQRRNEAEARKMEAQAHHWEIKSKVESGAYVEREAFELELTKRAIVFKADAENFQRANLEKIIAIVAGDPTKGPTLLEFLLDGVAEWLDRYATDKEITVPAPAAMAAVVNDKDFDEGDSD
jgi:hypothetical protein